jgi:hypothetical protein
MKRNMQTCDVYSIILSTVKAQNENPIWLHACIEACMHVFLCLLVCLHDGGMFVCTRTRLCMPPQSGFKARACH